MIWSPSLEKTKVYTKSSFHEIVIGQVLSDERHKTSFVYDANNQTKNVIHRKTNGLIINSFQYNYDAAGNRTTGVPRE